MRLLAACCVCGAGLSAFAASERPARPDVFLITIDTLRADHVHCYGDAAIETPALDRLAAEGVRFGQAFTPSPITNTSHASILTGLLPAHHGVTDFGMALAEPHITGAQLLKMRGYRTAAFIGAVILDSRSLAPGFNRGFDFYDNFAEHPTTKSRWGRVERRGLDVVRRAEAWLGAHPSGPSFVWMHLYDPHDPYEPPAPFSETYKDRLYDGEIAYADSAVAHFVAFLKASARYRDALIIVVGDHGEGLGDHHEETHGIFLYDSTLHIPLILKLPRGANAGVVVAQQVRTIDILPTILDLTGAATRELDGESLKPYFASAGEPARTSLAETGYPARFGWAPLRSVRADGFQFIEAPKPELYDIGADPGELENRYEPWNPRVQTLRATLAKAPTSAEAGSRGATGAGTVAELKALGYLGPADVGSATNVPEPSLLPDPKDRIGEHNLIHRAMLAEDDGRAADARSALEAALALNAESYIALRQLGELESAEGNFARAAELFKRTRAANPNDAGAASEEGAALEQMRDYSAARAALEASLRLEPEALAARLALARVCLELHDPAAAEDQFQAALLAKPGNVDAILGLARALLAAGKFEAAIRALVAPSASAHPNPEIVDLLAKAYRNAGRTKEAEAAESRARELRRPGAVKASQPGHP